MRNGTQQGFTAGGTSFRINFSLQPNNLDKVASGTARAISMTVATSCFKTQSMSYKL